MKIHDEKKLCDEYGCRNKKPKNRIRYRKNTPPTFTCYHCGKNL